MSFLGRARYNLLQIKYREDSSLQVQPWQVEDYRSWDTKRLFDALKECGLLLDQNSFEKLADEYESPETLIKGLPKEFSTEKKLIYLLVFELWRRLLVDRMTISIFCDELDWLIDKYEKNAEVYGETLVDHLNELIDILDANVDIGQKPRSVFKLVSSHSAHDLEHFLYNYIFIQIDQERETLASELLDDFYDYMKQTNWFDFLRLKLLRGAMTEEASAMLARFTTALKEQSDLELYFEFLQYLIQIDQKELFLETYRYVATLIKTEEHYLQMINILIDFYSLNDFEQKEKELKRHIEDRKEIPFHKKILKTDKLWLQKH